MGDSPRDAGAQMVGELAPNRDPLYSPPGWDLEIGQQPGSWLDLFRDSLSLGKELLRASASCHKFSERFD